MNPLLHKYPLDVTGVSPQNRVTHEYHDVSRFTRLPYRPIVLDHGYFFADTITVMDNTGYRLVKDVDYQLTALNAEAVQLTGQEVCGVIVITNPDLPHTLYVDANMLGGKYSQVTPAIVDLARTLLNDTRSTAWHRIEDRPPHYRPNGHLHGWWHLYGFEGYRDRINAITALIRRKSSQEIRRLEDELQARYSGLYALYQEQLAKLDEHINDKTNPHQDTKHHIGLGLVENYPVATLAEANSLGGGRNDRYMTPGLTYAHGVQNFLIRFNQHVADRNNPHGVTPPQADTLWSWEIDRDFLTRLGKTETAAGTLRVEGQLAQAIYDQARRSIPAEPMPQLAVGYVGGGRFPPSQLGSGVANGGTILLGNGQWVSVSTLLSGMVPPSTPIFYMGYLGASDNARQHVIATYNSQPVGTIVLFHDQWVHYHEYTNGGTFLANIHNMQAMSKTAGGWIGPFTENNIGNNRPSWP